MALVETVRCRLQRGIGEAHRLGEPRQRVLVRWNLVDTALLPQLEPVLDGSQPAIRDGQSGGVVLRDVATRGQVSQCLQRASSANGFIRCSMNELQQLYAELDVADSARAELYVCSLGTLPFAERFGRVLLDTLLHLAHARYSLRRNIGGEDERARLIY